MEKEKSKFFEIICKLALTAGAVFLSVFAGFFLFIITSIMQLSIPLAYLSMALLPTLMIPCIYLGEKKAKYLKFWGVCAGIYGVAVIVNISVNAYNDRITVDTSPNIYNHEYLPFEEDSKIVKLDHDASLKLTGDLPVVDGAAAVFPVYSAFVHATYPDTVSFNDGTFEYNNTVGGYKMLSEKETDIFFGAYPSEEQIADAQAKGTTYEYTPIGHEAFVFFVHKNNPIDNLTTEQIQGIYSGEITNWKDVGGRNEKIAAFQRNEGSGSQSMLKRFMGDKELMDPLSELINDFMSGIVERVSDYKSRSGSIGFSFRYYMEGIIKNPDIKLLSIDGIAPTVENIKSGAYPVTTPLYAVTYEGNDNENVDKLIEWILSDEGQEIIERTGYAGVR